MGASCKSSILLEAGGHIPQMSYLSLAHMGQTVRVGRAEEGFAPVRPGQELSYDKAHLEGIVVKSEK